MEKSELINEIRDAFKDIELDGGVGLWEAQGLDDYSDSKTLLELRKRDEKKNWKKISYNEIAINESSLSFFDAKGMLFHLPIYLIFDILEEEIYPLEGLSAPDILFTLSHELEGDYQIERFSLLNDRQIMCVIHFLEYKMEKFKKEHDEFIIGCNFNLDPAYIESYSTLMANTLALWNKKIKTLTF